MVTFVVSIPLKTSSFFRLLWYWVFGSWRILFHFAWEMKFVFVAKDCQMIIKLSVEHVLVFQIRPIEAFVHYQWLNSVFVCMCHVVKIRIQKKSPTHVQQWQIYCILDLVKTTRNARCHCSLVRITATGVPTYKKTAYWIIDLLIFMIQLKSQARVCSWSFSVERK